MPHKRTKAWIRLDWCSPSFKYTSTDIYLVSNGFDIMPKYKYAPHMYKCAIKWPIHGYSDSWWVEYVIVGRWLILLSLFFGNECGRLPWAPRMHQVGLHLLRVRPRSMFTTFYMQFLRICYTQRLSWKNFKVKMYARTPWQDSKSSHFLHHFLLVGRC